MKILLFHEFSGLHENLRDGLVELGHEVTIASRGDGFKNFKRDINLESSLFSHTNILGKIERQLIGISKINKLIGYDVVQTLTLSPYSSVFNINARLLSKLFKNNGKSFYLASGCDSNFYYSRDKKKYAPCKDCLISKGLTECPIIVKNKEPNNNFLMKNIDGIIPIMYDYKLAYEGFSKLKDIILIPVNTSKIRYQENVVKNKLILFHGISRSGFKGSSFIMNAMKSVKEKYPNDIELRIVERVPFNEYIKLLVESNVVLDQTNSYSYGLNALFAMSLGKIVMSGNELDQGLDYNEKCPVINIKPSVKQIVSVLELLLTNRNKIKSLGYQSRKYVEDYHSHLKIAKEFINTWNG